MAVVRFLGDNTGYKIVLSLDPTQLMRRELTSHHWVTATTGSGANVKTVAINLRLAYLIEPD